MGKRYGILKNPVGPVAKRAEFEIPAEESLRKSLPKVTLDNTEILLRKGLAHSNKILDHAKEALSAIGAEKGFREADRVEIKEIIEELNGQVSLKL